MRTAGLQVTGLMLAAALILSYIESQIPLPFGVPGMKLGLANLAVVLLLYLYGARAALAVNVMRILLSGFLFGGISAILFSLAGGAVSFVVMALLKKSMRFGIPGVSIAGGVAHNAGQLLVAALVVKTYGVLYLIPPLMIAGAVTGLVIGLLAARLLPVLRKIVRTQGAA